ncbi:formate dehydrogenase [Cryptococcus neoformans var. grubii H99]|uniref:Formate dehydrogenase n=1 Tax=Cryptococcus neoformans (strain H99 / ATCC 208821 / CBS 10515 / FGSC 9487) TaxID=235443 RepID=W8CET4_CRYN9|nr:formate dehydrogenase [Cryptococcus neoformans var. grubii H99]AFR93828.1 formate dehydrogenase [Cryptococcus neoformans var. grubii H99]AUB23406.1 formate dehydrogenase [Cryptococcus neoformans var. grubii]|eukprot:XP_012048187.1 formate dehydrogenase [Cryptococcus neoformans var. grubii H99]
MVKILAILYSGGKTVEKGNRLLGTVEKQIWHQKLAQKRRARVAKLISDHSSPWKHMADPLGGGNGMVPHYSGTTLDAQTRYAGGAKGIIGRYFAGEAQNPANLIVIDGDSATRTY